MAFLAVDDAGAHYCSLNESNAEWIQGRLTESDGPSRVLTAYAYGTIAGKLFIHRSAWLAETGEDVDIGSTVLVCPDWRMPSVLGYVGALDRLRLAIDPWRNSFAFGSV